MPNELKSRYSNECEKYWHDIRKIRCVVKRRIKSINRLSVRYEMCNTLEIHIIRSTVRMRFSVASRSVSFGWQAHSKICEFVGWLTFRGQWESLAENTNRMKVFFAGCAYFASESHPLSMYRVTFTATLLDPPVRLRKFYLEFKNFAMCNRVISN